MAVSTIVHPDNEGAVVLFPVCDRFKIMTSPETTPVGLLMVNEVLVVVAVVDDPRTAIFTWLPIGVPVFPTVR